MAQQQPSEQTNKQQQMGDAGRQQVKVTQQQGKEGEGSRSVEESRKGEQYQGGMSRGSGQMGRQMSPSSMGQGSMMSRTSPFAAMRRMMDDMDRFMQGFGFGRSFMPSFEGFERSFGPTSDYGAMSFPQVDVVQREGNLIVKADLPGLSVEDLNIRVSSDSLIIEGERRQEHEQRGESFYRSERTYGSFYREIPLPEGAKSEQAKASFKDGVLEIILPVSEEGGRWRRIELQGDSKRKESTPAGTTSPTAGEQTRH